MVKLIGKRWFQVILFLVLVGAFVFFSRFQGKKDVVTAPDVLADVAGKNITSFEMGVALNRALNQEMVAAGKISSAGREMVILSTFGNLLNDKLMERLAEEEGVVVTPADMDLKKMGIIAYFQKAVDEKAKEAGKDPGSNLTPDEMFRNLWGTLGFKNEKEFMEYIKIEILEEKLSLKLFPESSFTITDQEITDLIPKVELRQIHFMYGEPPKSNLADSPSEGQYVDINQADDKNLALSKEVYRKIVNGASFEEMAKKYSNEPQAADGGYIGWVTKQAVVPEFWDIASRLKPGDVTEPFMTPQGIHILKCLKAADPSDPVFNTYKKSLMKVVVFRKRKAQFVGWFYQKFRKLEEENKIIIYYPVVNANKLRNMGKYDEAIEEYKKAILMEKEQAPYYHIDIAMIYARQKKYTEALTEIRMATEMAPTDPMLFFAMGQAYMEVGEHEKAMAEFEKASSISRLNYDLHMQLMKIYTKLGFLDKAESERQKYVHAVELLSGGGKSPVSPSMFKSAPYQLPKDFNKGGSQQSQTPASLRTGPQIPGQAPEMPKQGPEFDLKGK